MSVDEIAYKTLDHIHPGISTAVEMSEYSPYNKVMELGSNLSLTLSSINPERSLETQKIFHTENH